MGYAELILVVVIPFTAAALIGFLLPKFSRGFLGPAVILLTLIACVFLVKKLHSSDAWGAVGAVVLLVGAVGAVSGVILIVVGAVRASRERRSSL